MNSEFTVKTKLTVETDMKKAINDALNFKSAMRGYLSEFKNARKSEMEWLKQQRKRQKIMSGSYNFEHTALKKSTRLIQALFPNLSSLRESIKKGGDAWKENTSKFNKFARITDEGLRDVAHGAKGLIKVTRKMPKGVLKVTKAWAKLSILKPAKLFGKMTKGIWKTGNAMRGFALSSLGSLNTMRKLSISINETEDTISGLNEELLEYQKNNDKLGIKKTTMKLKSQNAILKAQKMSLKKTQLGWTFLAAAATGAMMWMISSSPALNAQLGIMRTMFGLIGLTLGNVMAPAFQLATEKVVAFAMWFMNLDPIIHEAIVVFVLVTIAVTALTIAVVLVNMSVMTLIGSMLLAAAPIIILIAIITAIILIFMNWDKIMTKLKNIMAGNNVVLKAIIGLLLVLAAVFFGPIIAVIVIIVLLIKNFDKLKTVAITAFTFIAKIAIAFWKTLKDTFLIGDIIDIFTGMFNVIGNMIGGIVQMFADIGTGIVAILTGNFDLAIEMAKEVFMAPIKLFGSVLKLFFTPMRTVMDKIANAKILPSFVKKPAKVVRNIIDKITDMVPSFEVGTRGLPRDMVIQAHRGEIIIPSKASREVRAGRAVIGGGGGKAVATGGGSLVVSPTIYLNIQTTADAEETAMLAKDLIMRDMERLVSRQ